MTKDNFLFAVIGLLLGFITGYLMHEVMAARQPARRMAAEAASMAPDGAGAAMPSPGPAAGGGGGPAMAEIAQLAERVRNNPEDAEALLQLANLNFDIRNWPRAEELYTRFLALRPDQPDVMTDLAICYKESGKPDLALELLRRVQKVDPAHWPSVYNEVFVLLDLGRQAEAEEALARLRRLQPDDPRVQQLAAEVERRRAA